jgi:hypothetical protein
MKTFWRQHRYIKSVTKGELMVYCCRFTLHEFAEILLDYGFVQAINLDGGGSATYVVDGVLANYPSDKWYVCLLSLG